MVARAALLAAALLVAGRGAAAPGSVNQLADGLAERVRAGLAARGRADDVALCVHGLPAAAARELAELLATRLRGQLASLDAVCLLDDEAAARGFERVLALTATQVGERARVAGELRELGSRLWNAPGAAAAHVFAEVALDAEWRSFAGLGAATPALTPTPPPVSASRRVRTQPLPDLEVLAATVGDGELYLLTRDDIVVFSPERDGRVVERRRVHLGGTAAPSPPRTPTGALAWNGHEVHAHLGSVVEAWRWHDGRPEAAVGWRWPGTSVSCDNSDGVDWWKGSACKDASWPERFWAAAGLQLGDGGRVLAWVVPPTFPSLAPQLRVRAPAGTWELGGVGAQLAVGHLARGDVVAVSDAVLAGEPDGVTVRQLAPQLPALERVDKLGGNVRALAIGALQNFDGEAVLAVVRDAAQRRTELWIIE